MRIANIYVKDLYKFVNTSTKIHMVFYDSPLFPDYFGKLSELVKYRLYDSIYDGQIDRIYFSLEEREYLNIYVSLKQN